MYQQTRHLLFQIRFSLGRNSINLAFYSALTGSSLLELIKVILFLVLMMQSYELLTNQVHRQLSFFVA